VSQWLPSRSKRGRPATAWQWNTKLIAAPGDPVVLYLTDDVHALRQDHHFWNARSVSTTRWAAAWPTVPWHADSGRADALLRELSRYASRTAHRARTPQPNTAQ
jgi:hypothetical protein